MSRINFDFSPSRNAASGIINSIENVTGIFDKIMGIAILVIFTVLLLAIFIFGPGEPVPQYGTPPGNNRVGKIVKGSFFKNIIPAWYKEYIVYEQKTANGNRWNYYLNIKNPGTMSGFIELERNSPYRLYDGDYVYFNNESYTLIRDDKLKDTGLTVSVTF
jgi:hypothetical protein